MRIVKRLEIKATPCQIWEALTTKRLLAKWWGKGIELQPKSGGRFHEPWKDDHGGEQLASGTVLSAEKAKEIKFTWREKFWPEERQTVCLFRIENAGPKTALVLEHSGWECFPPGEAEKMAGAFEAGWNDHFTSLKAFLET